ncbi:MAG: hypothetical protein HDQ87_09550 [Clostridia bacterium]|nr:hypothetical protein [Clostridia bacterium]
MSVEYVQHRPGGAGEDFLNDRIAGVMRDPLAQIFVITPSRSTFQAEEQIIRRAKLPGHLGLRVMGPSQLVQEIIAGSYGSALETLPEFDALLTVRGIIRDHKADLPVFGQYDTMGFASQVVGAISNLRRDDVQPEALLEYAAKAGNTHVSDLALVYDEYLRATDRFLGAEDRMNLAIEHMSELRQIRQVDLVVIRGFAEYSEQEMRLVEALIQTAPKVLLSVYGSDGDADRDIYQCSMAAGARFVRAAEQSGIPVKKLAVPDETILPEEIDYASRHLFSAQISPYAGQPDSVAVSRGSSREEEVRAAAEEIVRLHLEEEIPFGEMAVIYGRDDTYADIAEQVFSEANIPHFVSRPAVLNDTGVGACMIGAAGVMFGKVTAEDLLDYYAGIQADPKWTAALRDLIRGANLEQEDVLPVLQQRDRSGYVFKQVSRELQTLRESFAGMEAADAGELYRDLAAFLRRKWYGRRDAFAERTADIALFETVDKYWMQGLAIIDSLAEQLDGQLLEPEEAREILGGAFAAAAFVPAPTGADEVQIGQMGAIQVPKVHTLFMLGVNDEVLPHFAPPTGDVLTDEEKAALQAGLGKRRRMSRSERQKFLVVEAMRMVSRRIWLSYNAGEGLKHSVLVERLQNRIFPDFLQEQVIDPNAFQVAENVCDTALREMTPDQPIPSVLKEPEFAKRLRALQTAWKGFQQPAAVPDAAPAPAAVSSLQSFMACPYKYYLEKGLNAQVPDRKNYELLAGTYMHRVLELLGQKVLEDADSPVSWSDVPEAAFERLLEESLQEAAGEPDCDFVRNYSAADLSALQKEVRDGVYTIRHRRTDDLMRPIDFEFDFEAADGSFRGRIDRLDSAEIDGRRYYYVTDYKSSTYAQYELQDVVAGGSSLQLIFYAMALRSLIEQGRLEPGDIAGAGFLCALVKHGSELEDRGVTSGFLSVSADAADQLFGRDTEKKQKLSSLRKITIKKDGSSYANCTGRLLAHLGEPQEAAASLETVMAYVHHLLASSADTLQTGRIEVQPSHKTPKENPEEAIEDLIAREQDVTGCKFCQYVSICRFDLHQPGISIRCVPSSAKAAREILEHFEEAGE